MWKLMPIFLPLECVRNHEVFTPHLAREERSVALTSVKEITGGSNYWVGALRSNNYAHFRSNLMIASGFWTFARPIA